MSNDYILPPVPQSFFDEFGVGAAAKVMGYGHAVAAPLLARIAKLERSVIECANTGVRMMDVADQEIARLRAEVEALTAASAALVASNDALREDAERLSFLYTPGIRTESSALVSLEMRYLTANSPEDEPTLDEARAAIDAAIVARKGAAKEPTSE